MSLPTVIQVALTDLLEMYGTGADRRDINAFAEDNDYDSDILWRAYEAAAQKLKPYIGQVVDSVSQEGV